MTGYKKILIGLMFSLAFAPHALAATAADYEREILTLNDEACEALSEAEARLCLVERSRQSAALVARVESDVVSFAKRWDEDRKYKTVFLRRLKESQKSYRNYRRDQCRLHVARGGGAIGNALEMLQSDCEIKLNIERVRDLMTQMEWRTGG